MLLVDLVRTWNDVRSTRSRKAKIELLAVRLGELSGAETEIGVSFLSGKPRQEPLGVGYRTIAEVSVPPTSEPRLTLTEVDATFGEIAGSSGPGSNRTRRDLLEGLMAGATEDEQRFLRGLVLRELRQGALEGILAEALAKAGGASPDDVRRALMLSGSLKEVGANLLREGPEWLAGFSLTMFTPLKPMLAQTAASVQEALGKMGEAAIETKYDGARVQVHRRGTEVRIYTRNLRDITSSVPEIVDAALAVEADAVILDGEAISYRGDGTPEPFQETISRFAQDEASGSLAAVFFDVLHVEGDDLIDRPQRDRFRALRAIAPEASIVPGILTSDVSEAERFYAEALASGQEGVVIKDPKAPYEAGRRGASWLKVKPAHTLDLVVLAAEWGSGRRKGWLSNLHLGARDPATGGFVMLGKTFKGLTDEMLDWQTERFLGLERDRDDWTVYVEPTQVVEVAFDGVQASPRYPGGVALRFARVKRYRDDKTADEADTIDTVRSYWRG